MPLNDTLYQLLCQRFGTVKVANSGEALSGRYAPDASGRTALHIGGWGESYCVDCPFCNDTRGRLYLNHRYGVPDPLTGSDNLNLARCFNEDCLRRQAGNFQELRERVFGFLNRQQRRQLLRVRPGRTAPTSAAALTEAPPPGTVVGLSDLPDGHPALAYLRERGYDPAEVAATWQVGYCDQAAAAYPLADGRLIVPVVMNGVRCGWQARHVGDLDWKQAGVPKYYTRPGLPRRLVLYNHDAARRQPCVVVCEGPTDVWRVGPAGVALLGKQASREQLRLLVTGWASKPVVVLLDGDAGGDACRLSRQLQLCLGRPVLQVDLPDGRDPGDYGRDALWSLIREQADRQDMSLPAMNQESPALAGDGQE